jgi:hypothetical protein
MHKRRISGLVIYGNRASKPNYSPQKLQGGGYVGVASGYEWRDDPYEMRLMQMEAQEKASRAKARASSKKVSTGKDVGSFTALSGGLKAATANANNVFEAKQNEYFQAVQSNPEGWAGSVAGKQAYQSLLNFGTKLQNGLVDDKKHFEEALSNYKNVDDKEALAISADNEVLISDGAGGVRAVHMSEYTKNMKDMHILKVKDLIKWKRDQDTSMNTNVVDAFMNNGSLGSDSIYKAFIEPQQDKIDSVIRTQIHKMDGITGGTPGSTEEAERFKGLFEKMSDNTSVSTKLSPTDQQKMYGVLAEVYGKGLSYSDDRSRLTASLNSEVLSKPDNRAKLEAIEDIGERNQALAEMVVNTFVSKVVYKGNKIGSGESGSGGSSGGGTITFNRTLAGYVNSLDGSATSKYTYQVANEQKVDDKDKTEEEKERAIIEKRVGFRSPEVTNILTAHDLNTADPNYDGDVSQEVHNNSLLTKNKEFGKLADTSNIYLADGTSLKSMPGVSSTAAASTMALIPGQGVSMVWLPKNKESGKLMMAKYEEMLAVGNKSREDFLKARAKYFPNDKIDISEVKPSDLYEGGKAQDILLDEYKLWVKYGLEPADHKGQNTEGYAKASSESLMAAEKIVKKIFPPDTIVMEAFARASVIVDDDASGIVDKYDESVGKYGKDAFLRANTSDNYKYIEGYMEDVLNIDAHKWKVGWGDRYYITDVFVPIFNATAQAGAEGANKASQSFRKANEQESLRHINNLSIASAPSRENTAAFLLGQ